MLSHWKKLLGGGAAAAALSLAAASAHPGPVSDPTAGRALRTATFALG